MTRKEFLKICSILGISLPLQSVFGTEQFIDSPKKSINKIQTLKNKKLKTYKKTKVKYK